MPNIYDTATPVASMPVGNSGYQRQPGTEDFYNPYAAQTRKKTWWDSAANWFGFRSGYDKWQDKINLEAAEYDSRILEMLNSRAYDSPAAQVERMTAAGLNPDLNGGSNIDPGNSNMPDPDPNRDASIADGSDLSVISGFSSQVGRHVMNCVSILSGLQGIAGKALQNRLANITGDAALLGMVRDNVNMSIPASPVDRDVTVAGDRTLPANGPLLAGATVQTRRWQDDLEDSVLASAERVPAKDKAKYRSMVHRYINSAEFKDYANDRFASASESKMRQTSTRSMEEAVLDLYQHASDWIRDSNERRLKTVTELGPLMAHLQKRTAENDLTFLDRYDPELKAQSVNESSRFDIAQSKFMQRYLSNLSPEMKAIAENWLNNYNASYYGELDGGTQASASNALAEYNRAVTTQLDPSLDASARNARWALDFFQLSQLVSTYEATYNYVKAAEERSKSDDWWTHAVGQVELWNARMVQDGLYERIASMFVTRGLSEVVKGNNPPTQPGAPKTDFLSQPDTFGDFSFYD